MSDETATETSPPKGRKRVIRNDEAGRYEIWVGDQLGGFSEVEIDAEGRAVFPHTEVDPAFKGQGLGSTLVAESLADAVRRGQTIVPECPFVKRYLRDHEVPGAVIEWPERVARADDGARDGAAGGASPA